MPTDAMSEGGTANQKMCFNVMIFIQFLNYVLLILRIIKSKNSYMFN